MSITSYAGCEVHEGKNPYWFMGLWYSKNICFTITLIVGIIICFYGKFAWEFTHFVAGSGLVLTIMLTVLYPAFERKGYRIDWMLAACFPLAFFFAGMFGWFLTHFPRGGCWWLGLWLGYEVGSNVFYNVPFNFIKTNTLAWYWVIVALTEIGMIFLLKKTKPLTKRDKTFHLTWQAPLFGGYLLGICWLIMAQNSPHSIEFAIIRRNISD